MHQEITTTPSIIDLIITNKIHDVINELNSIGAIHDLHKYDLEKLAEHCITKLIPANE